MLPVFLNPQTGEHDKPNDYIQLNAPRQREPYNIMEQRYHERMKLKTKELNDAFSLCNIKPPETSIYTAVSPSSTPIPTKTEYIREKIPDTIIQATAYETTSYNNSTYNSNVISTSSSSSLSSSSPASVYEYEVIELPENNIQNFPDLPVASSSQKKSATQGRKGKNVYTPVLANEKTKVNRVIRIVPQKSPANLFNFLGAPNVLPLVDRYKKKGERKKYVKSIISNIFI